jgi:hypothetical protein
MWQAVKGDPAGPGSGDNSQVLFYPDTATISIGHPHQANRHMASVNGKQSNA